MMPLSNEFQQTSPTALYEIVSDQYAEEGEHVLIQIGILVYV